MKQRVYVITARYQGCHDGIELITLDKEEAKQKYRQLVRQALGGQPGPWEEIRARYSRALDATQVKVEEYQLDSADLDVPSGTHVLFDDYGDR